LILTLKNRLQLHLILTQLANLFLVSLTQAKIQAYLLLYLTFQFSNQVNFTGLPQVPSTPYIVGATPRPNGISPVQDPTSGSNAVGPEAVAAINIPNIPMNFTGLPNIPVPPAAQVYSPPAMPAYTQPRVEDIIAPIRTGSTRRLPQPGLFNLR
jgi:hypothetical protein